MDISLLTRNIDPHHNELEQTLKEPTQEVSTHNYYAEPQIQEKQE